MRIGINMLPIIPGQMGGMEAYARGLVRGLGTVDRRNEYVLFANRENAATWDDLPESFSVHECPVSGRRKPARTLYEQLRLNRLARSLGIELLHSLVHVAPPPVRGRPSVVTIGDIIFLRFPREFTFIQRRVAGFLCRRAARTCDRILTFSEFSKADVQEEFGVTAGKITATPLGTTPLPEDSRTAEAFFREFRIPEKYLFSVLATYHHKNLEGLLRAFRELKQRRTIPHHLVVCGLKMAGHREFLDALARLEVADSVIFTGWAPDAALRELHVRADCFVYPSLYEGFGLPVLDAMSLGTPVACSNVTSLPEVAGDAAALFDPNDPGAIAEAVWRCLADSAYRASLVEKGRARAATFTWENCARKTLETYRELGAQ